MPGKIGATVASLVDVTQTSTDTQGATADTASQASQIANRLNTEIEETTTVLRTHFSDTAERLRSAVQQHLTHVESSDWDGASKEQARAAATDMNSQIALVLERAQQGVDDFKTRMTTDSQNFLQAIETDFNRIMTEAGERFSQFGTAVDTFRQRLEDADQTIRYQ